MLPHDDFVKWLTTQYPNTEQLLLNKIVVKTSLGVAPEGADATAVRAAEILFKHLPTSLPIQPPAPTTFTLGQRSQDRLAMLKSELRSCVEGAIKLSICDFTVLQTIRTEAEQVAAVRAGNSRTMKSKHLMQTDGFAHAVDLGAWVDGRVNWSTDYYASIAFAMDQVATQLGVASHVRWGAAWDRVLSDFGGSHGAYLTEANAYAKRHAGSDLIDMPHFEWVP